MTYAVIAKGSKQYRLEVGKTYELDNLNIADKTVVFDQVLLYVDGDKVEIGTPYIKDISVTADILVPVQKGDKLRIFKYKAKSRYRKTRGYRKTSSLIKVVSIGKSSEPKPTVKSKSKSVPKIKK